MTPIRDDHLMDVTSVEGAMTMAAVTSTRWPVEVWVGIDQDVLAVAEAVARTNRATFLNVDNTSGGQATLAEAAASGRSFFVVVRDDVLALEVDERGHLPVVAEIVRVLDEAGITPVVVASGREHHVHVFARLPRGPLRERVERLAVEGTGSRIVLRTAIRPPLAPHRLGLPVALLHPSTIEQTIEALRPLRHPASARTVKRLSAPMYDLLLYGDRAGRYDTRSEVVQALVTAMAQADWPETRIRRVLLNPRNTGGTKAQEIQESQGPQAAERYVRVCIDRAREFIARSPAFRDRAEAIVWLAEQRDNAVQYPWAGSEGHVCLLVLLSLIDLALRVGQVLVSAGTRTLAEHVGISRKTVSKSLTYLSHEGWITKASRGRGKEGDSYQILHKEVETNLGPLFTYPKGCEASGPKLDPAHDAFRHGAGLGKNGYMVLEALHQPMTVPQIVQATGCTTTTVRRVLREMAMDPHHLVHVNDDLWTRLPDHEELLARLDQFALIRGTRGAGRIQARTHTHDRAAWEARRTRRDAPATPDYGPGWLDPATGRHWPRGRQVQPTGDGYVGDLLLSFRYRGRARHWRTDDSDSSGVVEVRQVGT